MKSATIILKTVQNLRVEGGLPPAKTCIDCPGCQGICAALIDVFTLPDVILRKEA